MKKCAVLLVAGSLALSLFAFDWKGEGGIVTVPAGGAAITADDITDVEALDKIVLADETAAVTATGLEAELTIKADISGAATLTFKDCAGIVLTGDNAGLTGHFAFENTPVTVGSNHALGGEDTAAATMKCGSSDAVFTFADGVDNYVDITVDQGAKFTAGSGGCFTNHGDITGTTSSGNFWFGTCHLYGYVTAPRNAFFPKALSGAHVHFEKGSRMGCTYASQTMCPSAEDITGFFHLHGPVTYCGTLQCNTPFGGLVCEDENVFTNRTRGLQFAFWSTRSQRELDLNGYSQRICGFMGDNLPNIWSDRPATLTMTAISSAKTVNFVVTPNISFEFDGAGLSQDFSTAQHTTKDSLYATAGTIRFRGTSQWLGTNVVVRGGTLEVGSSKALAAASSSGRRIVVSSGRLVVSNGVTVVTDTACIGGKEIDPDQYTQADFDALGLGDYVTCDGALVVNGPGGEWGGWPEAGGSAYIPAGATVTVPDEDVAKMAACASVFVATDAKLILDNKTVPLAWSVPVRGGGTVSVNATTNLVILADNRKFSGTFNFYDTCVIVSNRYGLGSVNTQAVNFDACDKVFALRFGGEGLVCDAPLYYTSSTRAKTYGMIGPDLPGETLTFSNTFMVIGTDSSQSFAYRGKIRFAGGTFGTRHPTSGSNNHLFSYSYDSEKAEVWCEADLKFRMSFWFAEGNVTYHMGAAGSVMPQVHGYVSKPLVVCERADALSMYGCIDRYAVLDLNGYSQTMDQLSQRYSGGGNTEDKKEPLTVTSAVPAMVTVTKVYKSGEDNYGPTRAVPAYFRGHAGYEHAVADTNAFYKYVSDTVAPMVISKGKLELRVGAGWAGTNVTIRAGAELAVAATSAATAFGRKTDLVIEEGGTLNLVGEDDVSCRSLTYGGEAVPPGDHKAGSYGITGAGVLNVIGRKGTLFFVGRPTVRYKRVGGIVVRTDYKVPLAWSLKSFCGRDWWPGFYANSQNAHCSGYGAPDPDWDLDIFRESMVEFSSYKPEMSRIIRSEDTYAVYNSDFLEKDQYEFRDYFDNLTWSAINGTVKKSAPMFLGFGFLRPEFFLPKEFPCEREAFKAWRAANPTFVGIGCLGEFDSEASGYGSSVANVADPALKAELLESFPLPTNEDEWMENAREAHRRVKEMVFGCDELWSLCSQTFSLSLMMADIGLKGLWYEATGQEYARWQLAGAYLRGAARQFDIPYGWYTAHWYTGYRRTDSDTLTLTQGSNYWTGDKTPGYNANFGGPWRGLGRTMLDRQNAYGWLIGCSFCQIEDWVRLYRDIDENGKFCPHQVAIDFDNLCRMAKTTDRGTVYAPCALLVPVAEKYGASGLSSAEDPYSLSSFFFTLVPIHAEDVQQRSLRKKGFQGCLFNTPFGEFYDCIAPDATSQSDVRVARALNKYKCAFLAGGYSRETLHTAALEKYVRDGGTLFISWDRIADGLIPATLAGVSFATDAQTVPAGEMLLAEDGVSVKIGSGYVWAVPEGTPDAQPFFRDENGRTAGWVHSVGRGRVVTMAAWRFMPDEYLPGKNDGLDVWHDLIDIFAGKRTFELVKALLVRAQDETMPVAVEGDVQWGLNKTKRGWLLWLINNNGVTHFTYEPEEYDLSKTAHVRATFKPTGKVYTADVQPGEWKLIEIRDFH